MDALTRNVEYTPGFDKRSADPQINYGISGGRLAFYVVGPKGAIQFMIGTGWFPASAVSHLIDCKHRFGYSELEHAKSFAPSGYDVGYHAHVAQYEGQSPMVADCHVLKGPCYYDGSSLRADDWLARFLEEGTEWLWPAMEQEYRIRFEGDAPESEAA